MTKQGFCINRVVWTDWPDKFSSDVDNSFKTLVFESEEKADLWMDSVEGMPPSGSEEAFTYRLHECEILDGNKVGDVGEQIREEIHPMVRIGPGLLVTDDGEALELDAPEGIGTLDLHGREWKFQPVEGPVVYSKLGTESYRLAVERRLRRHAPKMLEALRRVEAKAIEGRKTDFGHAKALPEIQQIAAYAIREAEKPFFER